MSKIKKIIFCIILIISGAVFLIVILPLFSEKIFNRVAILFFKNPKSVSKSSPDLLKKIQGKIVFQSDRAGNNEIYIMNANGSEVKRLTFHESSDECPAFSPDGWQVAFVSDRTGNREIFIMDLNSKNLQQITHNPDIDESPAWSLDGQKIYFHSRREGNEDIYVYTRTSQKTKRLTFSKAREILPAISPDGKTLAISVKVLGWQIYRMPANGGRQIQLTKISGNCRPDFSFDGKKIAFVTQRRDRKGDIFIMNSDGSEQNCLTFDSLNYDYDPVFSPDDKMIVYTKTSHKQKGPRNIWVLEIETGKEVRITSHSANDRYPDWVW